VAEGKEGRKGGGKEGKSEENLVGPSRRVRCPLLGQRYDNVEVNSARMRRKYALRLEKKGEGKKENRKQPAAGRTPRASCSSASSAHYDRTLLYEGVEFGQGKKAYPIPTRFSNEALADVSRVTEKANVYKQKKAAPAAHEAIRPHQERRGRGKKRRGRRFRALDHSCPPVLLSDT